METTPGGTDEENPTAIPKKEKNKEKGEVSFDEYLTSIATGETNSKDDLF